VLISVATMYVDTAKSVRNGKTYVRHLLRESYRENGRVKHRTVANLSSCSQKEIEAIRLALKHKEDLSELTPAAEIKAKSGIRLGAVFFLKEIAKRIGLPGVLGRRRNGRLALWQVFARLIGQGSRLSAVRLADRHAACDQMGLDAFNEEHLYENLSWLSRNQEKFEKRLFECLHRSGVPRLFLYDVTSSYFEGVKNELAAFGYNRDKKSGKMQVVIGLMTDEEGRPASVRVFEGNTKDNKTVAAQIRLLAKTFRVENVVFVGDRGMIKQAQISEVDEEKFNYITAITKPQIEKLIRTGTFQLELFADRICEVEDNGVRYVLHRNPLRAKEVEENRESKFKKLETRLKEKTVYLREHPKASVEVATRDIDAAVKKYKFQDWVKVKSEERTLLLEIDEDERSKKHRLDGCYAIKTDLKDATVGAEVIHGLYKDLAKVEHAFRTMKSGHLEVRPIFLRKEDRTRGHVFVVMLAYLLEKEIYEYWKELEVTVSEGIDELGSVRATEIEIGKAKCQKVPEPVGLAKKLLDSAGVRLPAVAPAKKVNVATRKKLVSERNRLK